MAIFIALVLSGIVGYNLGKAKKSGKIIEVFTGFFSNIENYVIVLSIVILIASLIYSGNSGSNELLSVILNIFATIIFSWLLTKKSTKADFKEKEEELAKRAYRHVNYLETAANTASITIEQYLKENEDIDTKAKFILLSVKEQVKYIQGGINTCKMDWYDLMSEKERSNHPSDSEEYGTVDTVNASEQVNQEDA